MEKVTKATGIDKVAKKVLGDDCGCNKRKEWLNDKFPYGSRKEARMSEADRSVMDKLIIPAYEMDVLGAQGQEIVRQMHWHYTGTRTKMSGCGGCYKKAIEYLIKLYHASCPKSE